MVNSAIDSFNVDNKIAFDISPAYKTSAMKINSIATSLKKNADPKRDIKIVAEEGRLDELLLLLMEIKHMDNFLPGKARFDATMDELDYGHDYSSVIFYEVFLATWKIYLSHSVGVDEEEPFLKIFNGLYKKHHGELVDEKTLDAHAWETKYKRYALRKLFREALADTGYKGEIKDLNLLNQVTFKKQLMVIGAPLTYFDAADEIYGENHVFSDESFGDVSGGGNFVSDAVAVADSDYADMNINIILDAIDTLNSQAKLTSNKTIGDNLKYFVTLKTREYVQTGDSRLVLLLEEYIDKDLLEYALNHEECTDVQILSQYTNQKCDTVRKKMRKIKNAFMAIAA